MIALEEKLKNLPDNPGVYIMLDETGTIIYVGKAKILKNRVRQYFHQSGNKTEKVMRMVERIADFTYIIAKSEKDALSLEANLIKKHKPYYNILLKDDKSYPYISVNLHEKYPAFHVTRRINYKKAKYFGPFMAGIRTKDILEILSDCFMVRVCDMNMDKVPPSHRACLNYHIGRCMAPCKRYVTEDAYTENVKRAMGFLSGNIDEVEELLTVKMMRVSENEDFERAIVLRNRIAMLAKLKDKVVSNLTKDIDMDIFGYVTLGELSTMSIAIIRGGKMVGSENVQLDCGHLSAEEAITSFIMQYYKRGMLLPQEVVIGVDETEALSGALSEISSYKVNVIYPKQGVRKQLLDLTELNAREYIEKYTDEIKRKEAMTVHAVDNLGRILNLKNPPHRMECYDISNISGTNKVASMVVMIGGEIARSEYRRFKIKTVEGANDFASMAEVIRRRLLHITEGEKDVSLGAKPDLIVVDGGKGQLSSALEAMAETGISVPFASLAKREEEIFLPNREDSIMLPKNSPELKLVQRLRDEAHRFAITYHRSLRAKGMTASRLDEIEGIGKKRRVALIKHFKTLDNIKNASIDEISKVGRIGEKLAETIKREINK